jgi:hypothetical protein
MMKLTLQIHMPDCKNHCPQPPCMNTRDAHISDQSPSFFLLVVKCYGDGVAEPSVIGEPPRSLPDTACIFDETLQCRGAQNRQPISGRWLAPGKPAGSI